MNTIVRVGRLSVEKAVQPESDGAGSPPRTDYRPAGVVLQNDGRWHHWMAPGETYRFKHDGTGWLVTCRSWPNWGHDYRLADEGGTFVDALPIDGRSHKLNRALTYEIAQTGEGWTLSQA